jgi:hypothetical protein
LERQKQGKIGGISIRGWRKKCENDSKFDTYKCGERIAPGSAMANWFLVATALLTAPGPLHAADLTAIERKIAKEPAYAGKPKYCLLVFGPEAKTRIWLALDGDKLYVDRNGNGDLTDDGPALAAKVDGDSEEATRTFKLTELREGSLTHRDLSLYVTSLQPLAERDKPAKALLTRDPAARGYILNVDVEMPGRRGNGLGGRVEQTASLRDLAGFLQFASSPREAPVIHFGGPWSITLYSADDLTVGREDDLVLSVGIPGIGPGTTAFVAYEKLVPTTAFPTAEITFPPKAAGEPPIKQLFELKERC